MRRVMSFPLLLLALASCLAIAGCQVSRAGYASAPFKVVKKDGSFELRDYPRLTVVETSMVVTNTQSSDGSFMRLFRFISGANEKRQKISMTTPVFMAKEKNRSTMAFVMPEGMKTIQTPKPTDASVTVRELPPGRCGDALQWRALQQERSLGVGQVKRLDQTQRAERDILAGLRLL